VVSNSFPKLGALPFQASGLPPVSRVVDRTPRLKTASSLRLLKVFGQFVAAPFGLARTAIRGMFVEWGYLLLVCIIPVTVICCQVNWGWFQRAGWAATPVAYLLTYAVVPFLLGRWMSRRYAAREGAASLTLSAFHATINLCFGLILGQTVRLLGGEAYVAFTFAKLESSSGMTGSPERWS
jgi:hypothetical protein